MNPWKRRFLLETIIFRFHVSFRGCISIPNEYFFRHSDARNRKQSTTKSKGSAQLTSKRSQEKKPLTFHNWVVFHPLPKTRKNNNQGILKQSSIHHRLAHLRCGQQSKPMPRSLANTSRQFDTSATVAGGSGPHLLPC